MNRRSNQAAGATTKRVARGIRNNNPMNIRRSTSAWRGKSEEPTDRQFEQFTGMTFGIRAGLYLLTRYVRDYHYEDIAAIVHHWCPDGDGANSEENYVRWLTQTCDIPAGVSRTRRYLFWLAAGICDIESRYKLKWDVFVSAFRMLPESMQAFWDKKPCDGQEREEVDGL